MGSSVANDVPHHWPPEFGRRRPNPTTETPRESVTGDGFGRGLRLWVAGLRAHPGVAIARARVVGAHRNGARGGAGVRTSAKTALWSTGE